MEIQPSTYLQMKPLSRILILAPQLLYLWLAIEEYFYFLKFFELHCALHNGNEALVNMYLLIVSILHFYPLFHQAEFLCWYTFQNFGRLVHSLLICGTAGSLQELW